MTPTTSLYLDELRTLKRVMRKEFYRFFLDGARDIRDVFEINPDYKMAPWELMAVFVKNQERRDWVAFRDGVSLHCACCSKNLQAKVRPR